MNEVLFNLYAITKDPSHLATARLFNHYVWSAPLAAGSDDLAGNHANTHIPEGIGNMVGYELTGNATDKAIAGEFFAAVTQNHSWATELAVTLAAVHCTAAQKVIGWRRCRISCTD